MNIYVKAMRLPLKLNVPSYILAGTGKPGICWSPDGKYIIYYPHYPFYLKEIHKDIPPGACYPYCGPPEKAVIIPLFTQDEAKSHEN